METIKCNANTIDLINARTASQKLQSAPEKFKVRAVAVMEDADKSSGEVRPVGYLFAETGEVYGTVSSTAIETILAVAKAVDAGDIQLPLTFKVAIRTSAAGRNFITLAVEE